MSREQPVRIMVCGTGTVGGYFGGRLAASGQDVTFIARGAHLDAIRRDGLPVSSTRGDVTIQPATATDDPSAVGVVDVVLLAVKAGAVAGLPAGGTASMQRDLMEGRPSELEAQTGGDRPAGPRARCRHAGQHLHLPLSLAA